jgi:hypothetical protein
LSPQDRKGRPEVFASAGRKPAVATVMGITPQDVLAHDGLPLPCGMLQFALIPRLVPDSKVFRIGLEPERKSGLAAILQLLAPFG